MLAGLSSRYVEVCNKIEVAAERAGRSGARITLLAVSKTFSAESICPLLDLGHVSFAENRVQEAVEKWPALLGAYEGIELHLVGALQSNKVRAAVELFDFIHSLDRERLARRLAEEMRIQAKSLRLFIQINIGEESQKAGVALGELDDFYNYSVSDLGLDVIGLTGIPPYGVNPAPYFALLQKRAVGLGLAHLSMGMSADYETAIAFGADYLRVGTAIFGVRDSQA